MHARRALTLVAGTLLLAGAAHAELIAANSRAGYISASITDSRSCWSAINPCPADPFPFESRSQFAFAGDRAGAWGRSDGPFLAHSFASINAQGAPLAQLIADGQSFIGNNLVIAAPGLGGSQALVFVDYSFFAPQLTVSGSVTGSVSGQIRFGGTLDVTPDMTLGLVRQGVFLVTLGSPNALEASSRSSCISFTAPGSALSCDAEGLLALHGISRVALLNGGDITNYTVTTEAGWVFPSPIPEPGTMLMLCVGLVSLLIHRRTQASQA